MEYWCEKQDGQQLKGCQIISPDVIKAVVLELQMQKNGTYGGLGRKKLV